MKTLTKSGAFLKKSEVKEWIYKNISPEKFLQVIDNLPELFVTDPTLFKKEDGTAFIDSNQLRNALSDLEMRLLECEVITYIPTDETEFTFSKVKKPIVKFTEIYRSGKRGGCTYCVVKNELGFYYAGTEDGARKFVDKYPNYPLFIYEVYDHVLQHKIF